MGLIAKIGKIIQSKLSKQKSDRFVFFDVGFHGDTYLLNLVDVLISNSQYFIETGTNVGSTLVYDAKKYPEISCFSCEPDKEAFNEADSDWFTLQPRVMILKLFLVICTPARKTCPTSKGRKVKEAVS